MQNKFNKNSQSIYVKEARSKLSALWKSVILQTMIDASTKSKKNIYKRYKNNANEWIQSISTKNLIIISDLINCQTV